MAKRTLKEVDINSDVSQPVKRRKLNNSDSQSSKKTTETKKSEKKLKSTKFKKDATISMKGLKYRIGSFEKDWIKWPEFKILCKSNKMTIRWSEMYPIAHHPKIEISLSSIKSIHIGTANNKEAMMTVITDDSEPKFYRRARVKGKTGFANPYHQTSDFTQGNALKNNQHQLILRCKPTKKILNKLFDKLVNCGKFADIVEIDAKFK